MNGIKDDWNSMAAAYERFNTAEDSYSTNIEWPCIRRLLPPLAGKSVLDLGCGTGIFTFLLEQYAPQKLVGLDLSEEMLRIAARKAEEKHSAAQFILADAERCAEYVDAPFDFVFSSTTTHYIEDLPAFFRSVCKCLKSGGCGVFSVIHPVYSALYPVERGDAFPSDDDWTVRYLDQSRRAYIQPWIEYNDAYENRLSRSFHHTFCDYMNALLEAGLQPERIEEPLPPDAWKETAPYRYESFLETPVYMILKFRRPVE